MPNEKELLEEVKFLKEEIKKIKPKKYGLLWETKDEDVVLQCKEELPVLIEDDKKEIKTDKSKPVNILIEGDNYHALSVLNYTHQGKIDVVYIDPPYNTGAKDWKYNNHFVDNLDTYRHSKWISMMNSRIRLAKKLLQNTGIFICAVDHYELFNLGLLCDEIFGEENRLGVITVVHKPEGRQFANFFSPSNEFMLVYAKNKNLAKFQDVVLSEGKLEEFNEEDEKGKFKLQNFIRLTDGKYSLRKNKPAGFYPIYVSSDLMKFSLEKKANYEEALPITNKGIERVWKTFGDTFMEKVEDGVIVAKRENGKLVLYEKLRPSQVLTTHWIDKKYHGYHYGTKLLEEILGEKVFDFPKSLYLLIDILKITTNEKAIILDFFAGSGTTGHAVLELNKADGGNRQVILCTNNENKIAENVCYPRMKKVIDGYSSNKGLGGNLKYYKTDFVDAEPTDINKKKLVDKSTEMLCLKDDCFNEIKRTKTYSIFTNNWGKNLGIIYDDAGIAPFKKEVEKINKKFIVYVFSLDESAREEEFEDIKKLVELKPIPAVILNVYKRIFK
ncbi:MAG: hypothetical protein A2528_03365 [Candidatus Staskawiczbacteria bacterium RIFOXYD2_FULL_37_9]|uniref:DNA methylase N-4/N-6 domain-containing protein n=1 Tax=Candidatus Staskawiczbacteria bacterium RIFOXYB1_FULL_37_44 TaxID=1802223 RepID=A0A1G2IX06_9BACT|nr:MAG: hypothetical protein A2358_02815 [Candidatus Staskawiczbacteria bacterium RIFOXYB1_FULL_37_44]OGZ83856.1 MAG: hypothetical protein A2416_02530 [Candidatus Staskawiczbacteria bacterium RIFOXYC1_FULL_37_52]OGZ89363.1 MAG: hypothetical protein A2581_00590 [Candidatus Staskawiczbacteria bacterium RIFOXYD1_FULL_37_110]OGZ94509.1 MAG: hypothetical protein A2528_03365 [Candidatus Staskawiczbacteria bacterium RIFOXYD2_FULL_37_9]